MTWTRGEPHEWETPAILRQRPDADRITCQAIVSGQWKRLDHRYWNDCVIPVKFRIDGKPPPRPANRTWSGQIAEALTDWTNEHEHLIEGEEQNSITHTIVTLERIKEGPA